MILLAKGAEAEVFDAGDHIVKTRLSKRYRIPEIDQRIIKSRLRKETNILRTLERHGIAAPRLIRTEGTSIIMEKIAGKSVKECLNEGNSGELMENVGRLVSEMHKYNIIHGDLTTLNFIAGDRVYVIDFGLSYVSHKDEDKAVDLYVFERALRCAHEEAYVESFYCGYRENGSVDVMKRLEEVRRRGRKREEEE